MPTNAQSSRHRGNFGRTGAKREQQLVFRNDAARHEKLETPRKFLAWQQLKDSFPSPRANRILQLLSSQNVETGLWADLGS